MKITARPFALFALCLGAAVFAVAEDDAASSASGEKESSESTTSRIKFSDPSKPGTLRAQLPWADVHVTSTDAAEIIVTSSIAEKGKKEQRADGLRRLDDDLSFELTEKNNLATLQMTGGWEAQGSEFNIQLPHHTALVLRTEMGGDVVIENFDGDIDVDSMNGEITLKDIVSSAVANTMNGEINASFKTAPVKPVSFSTMNGEISLRLPAETKANLRLRSQNGSLLTDFPEGVLKTKVESRSSHSSHARHEIEMAVHEAAMAGHEAAMAARDIARQVAHEVSREIHSNSHTPKAQASADSAVASAPAAAPAIAEAPEAVEAPLPPIPPVPYLGGGKVISGTLNGGGVDITLATMNGTITVRQSDSKAPAPAPAPKS